MIQGARPEPGGAATDAPSLAHKEAALRRALADLGSVVVAFSGGVDSAYLAWVAADVLGDRALAVTADSPSYPAHHRQLALRVVNAFALRHCFIQTDELSRPEYRANPENRCYYCKQELFERLTALARDEGYAAVVDGSNADDRGKPCGKSSQARSRWDPGAREEDTKRASGSGPCSVRCPPTRGLDGNPGLATLDSALCGVSGRGISLSSPVPAFRRSASSPAVTGSS